MENLPYELIETFLKYIAENNHLDMIGTTKTMFFFHYLLKITIILRKQIKMSEIPKTLCVTKLKTGDNYQLINKHRELLKSLISISMEGDCIVLDKFPRIKNIRMHGICQLPHKLNKLSTRFVNSSIKHLKLLSIIETYTPLYLPNGLLYLDISQCRFDSQFTIPETVKILVIGSSTDNELPDLPASVTKLSLFPSYNNYNKIITSNVRVLKCISNGYRCIFPLLTQFVNVTCLILGEYFSGISSLSLKFPPHLTKFVIDIACLINLDHLPKTVTSLHLHNLKNKNFNLSNNLRHVSIVSSYFVDCHIPDILSSLSLTCRSSCKIPISLRKLKIDNIHYLRYDLSGLVNLRSLTVFSKYYIDYNIDKLEKLKYLNIYTDTILRDIVKLPVNLMYFVINQNCVYDHIPKTLKYLSAPLNSGLPLKKPKYVILT